MEQTAAVTEREVQTIDRSGVGSVDEVLGTDDATTTGTGATGFIRTEAAPAEVPKPLKHRGTITSVVALSADTGSRGIEITAKSDSNGKDYKATIWPPRPWTDDVFITADALKQLPRPDGLTAKGNPKQSPYERFGKTIASTDGRAELQRFMNAVTEEGLLVAGNHQGQPLNGNYTDFDTLVENLNTDTNNIPIIFTTGADGDPDPEYGFRIKIKNFLRHTANYEKLKQEDASGQ